MSRTPEQWNALTTSPLITKEIYEVLSALWVSPQGLTKAEIDRTCVGWQWQRNAAAPWEKVVAVMAQMGITKRAGKRHCTVKNKPDSVWDLTDATVLKKPKVNKPSAKKYAAAMAQFEVVISYHESRGDGLITPDLRKFYDWARDKVAAPAAN